MPISFLTTALLIVSVITNLTVEGIKKLLDGTKVKYSSNVLAAILSVLIACAVSVIYLIMTDTVFTMKIGVEIVVLMYLGFLISTVGYDKVIQMLKQIQSVKEETKNDCTRKTERPCTWNRIQRRPDRRPRPGTLHRRKNPSDRRYLYR